MFFQLILPDVTQVRPYPTPFSKTWDVAGVIVRSEELTVLIVMPLLVIALWWFLSRTKYGLAIRGSAANADAARLAAVNIKHISTLVWVIAGTLAAIAAMLFAPLNPAGASALGVGPGMLLRVLTVALIAGMASLPIALASGVAIGMMESLVSYNYNDQRGLLDALLFVIVIVTLLLRGRRRGLAEADSGRWSFAPRIRPIPARLERLWWVRRLPVAGGLVVVLVALFPLVFLDLPSQREAWSRVLLYAMVALSLTVLTGWAGQLSLGQFAFVGVGGMTAAALVREGVGFVPSLVIAGVVTALVAIVVGLPALRRPGLYLAISTFAFAVMASAWLLYRARVPRRWRRGEAAPPGHSRSPPHCSTRDSICARRARITRCVWWHSWSCSSASRGCSARGGGASMIAVRDNERAAAALGISPTRIKLMAFGIGGWIAGVAGALLVGLVTEAQPTDFLAAESLRVISIVVIGGLSSVAGAVLGAFFVIGLPKLFDDSIEIGLLTSGAGLLILLLYFPGGLVQVFYSLRDAIFAWVARQLPAEPERAETRAPIPASLSVRVRPLPEDIDDVIVVGGLTVTFGARAVVDGVDLDVGRGEVVGLIGTNGAGKTTLMNAICGFVPSRGDIEILGRHARHLSPAARARLGLGRSFQGATLFPDLSVRETVGLAVHGVHGWQRSTRAEADEIIDFLGLGRFRDKFINELSTGTRRIVELACLMASGARVLCLDEPTAGIAQRESEAFVPLILRIRAELDASLLVIEHDMPVIMAISNRVYCLEAGRIIACRDARGGSATIPS